MQAAPTPRGLMQRNKRAGASERAPTTVAAVLYTLTVVMCQQFHMACGSHKLTLLECGRGIHQDVNPACGDPHRPSWRLATTT